jgi:hypothetical protein
MATRRGLPRGLAWALHPTRRAEIRERIPRSRRPAR